jgi:lambda family phage portal protein
MNIWPFKTRSFERDGAVRLRALWDAAGGGNRLANWTAPGTNFQTTIPAPLLKERARDAYRNNPWARRAVNLISTDAIGAGIKPQLRSDNADAKKAFQRAWNRWTDECDFNGRFDLYGFEKMLLQTGAVDGEALVRLIVSPGAARVPLQLQLLSSEFLDSSRVDSRTLNGIRYDDAGRRAGYWLYTKHPARAPSMVSVEIPAADIAHTFWPEQPGLERGTPWLAPVLVPLRELQEYMEAQLVRSKVAALFAGFVRTQDGSNPLNQKTDDTVPFEPGTMARLKAGEEIEFSTPPDVGICFDPFIRAQLRAIASGLNIPYEYLSGDLSGVTFASGRHALLAYKRQLQAAQDFLVVFQFLRPVLKTWVRLAIAAGELPGSPEDYEDVRWIGPELEMLDPKADVSANIQKVRAGVLPRSEWIARTGWDADQIDAEIAADNTRADRLGLVLDTDPRKTTMQGQEQQSATAQEQKQ